MRARRFFLLTLVAAALVAPAAGALTPTHLVAAPIQGASWVADPRGLFGFSVGGDLVGATLTAGGAPLVGKTLTFTTAGGRLICTTGTDRWGSAACPALAVAGAMPFERYEVAFDGDEAYAASRARGVAGEAEVTAEPAAGCWIRSEEGLAGCDAG